MFREDIKCMNVEHNCNYYDNSKCNVIYSIVTLRHKNKMKLASGLFLRFTYSFANVGSLANRLSFVWADVQCRQHLGVVVWLNRILSYFGV